MASAGRARPSLLGTVPPAQDFQRSILDALNEPEPIVQRQPGRTRWLQVAAACVGVAASATALVLLWAPPQAGPAHQPAVGEPLLQAVAPAAVVTAASAPAVHAGAPTSAASVAADGPVLAQAARIEDMAASSPDDTAVHPGVAASPFDKLAATAPAPAPAPAATKIGQASPPVTAAPKRADTKPREGNKHARAQASGNASSRSATATGSSSARVAKAPPAARARAESAGTSSDADVEIMAALMNHMNESAAADAHATDASIADLVRHCRSLPAADAQACQRRICQGYWGRAEACPAPRERAARVRTAG
jgi:hypothetical protein